MIMGGICTRRCPTATWPTAARPRWMRTSRAASPTPCARCACATWSSPVDRDDLRDGGGAHFAACIDAVRGAVPGIRVEVLTPDFRGREALALDRLAATPPDVFNHNIETVERLYGPCAPAPITTVARSPSSRRSSACRRRCLPSRA